MTLLESSTIYATLAGAMIPLGAFAGRLKNIRPRWLKLEFRHTVIAFGGGTRLGAVSLVLVPEGITFLSPGWLVAALSAGGVAFFWIDRLIARHGGSAALACPP